MGLNVGTLTVHLTGQDAKFRSMMGRASGALTRLRGQLLGVTVAASAAFAPLVGVGKMAATAAGDFEKGMARTAAVAQITSSKVERALSKTVLSLAAKTEFTARQVADAAGNLAQLGFTATEIMGALPSALELASAGMMDVAEASAIAAKIMRSQGFATQDLARVNDVLVSAFTGAAIDVQGLGEAFKFVGSVGKSAGVEFEELSAALGQLGNVGVPAEIAGTGLRKVIAGLVAPTGKSKKLIDELGLSALMAATDGFPRLADIVETLERKIASGTDEMDLMGKVVLAFGQRAGPTLQNLVNVGSASLREFTQRLRDSGGTAQRIAQKQLNTFNGRMKILASQVEGLAISVGNMLIPYIDRLAGAVSGIVGWFQKLPKAVKQSVVEFGVLATGALGALAAISGLTLILSPLVSALGIVAKAMMAAFSKPLLIAGALLSGLVLAIGYLRKAWDNNLFGMQEALTPVLDGLKEMLADIRAVMRESAKRLPWRDQLAAVGVAVDTLADGRHAFRKVSDPADLTTARGAVHDAVNASGMIFGASDKREIQRLLGEMLTAPVGSYFKQVKGGGFMAYQGQDVGPSPLNLPGPGAATGRSPRQQVNDALAEVTDTFKLGASTILEGFGFAKDFLTDQVNAFDPNLLGDLEGKVTGLVDGIKGFVDAIKKGGIDTTIAARDSAKLASRTLEEILFPSLYGIKKAIDAAASKLTKFGKASQTAILTIAEAAQTFRAMRVTPNVITDEDGAQTFDAGSLLGGSEIGGVLQGAGQGALVGGPFGAIIGALAAILVGAEKFQRALEYGGDTIGVLGDALAAFEGPMEAVHGQVRMITETIAAPLAGVMESFGKVLQAVTPILALINIAMEIVAVMLDAFAGVIEVVGDALKVLVQIISAVIRPILLAVLYWVRAIVAVWNGILNAITWVLRQIGKIPLVGDIADKIADGFDKLKVNTEGLDNAIGKLKRDIASDPFASDFVNDSIEDGARKFNEGADAAERAGEALKNVPEGYKVALRRFQAMDPIDSGDPSSALSRLARSGARDGRSVGDSVIEGLGGVAGASSGAADALRGLADSASIATRGFGGWVSGLFAALSGGGGGDGESGRPGWLSGVPMLASGGIVTGPTLAMVGEGNGAEAVMPLDRLREFIGGGGSSINIENLTVEANDPDDMLRQIQARASRQSYLRTGQSEPGAPRYTGRR